MTQETSEINPCYLNISEIEFSSTPETFFMQGHGPFWIEFWGTEGDYGDDEKITGYTLDQNGQLEIVDAEEMIKGGYREIDLLTYSLNPDFIKIFSAQISLGQTVICSDFELEAETTPRIPYDDERDFELLSDIYRFHAFSWKTSQMTGDDVFFAHPEILKGLEIDLIPKIQTAEDTE